LILDENVTVKLTDFGLSSINRDESIEHLMETQCGTLAYLAPEVIKGKQYTLTADIFSLGVVLFVLVTKLMPFEYATGKDWWYNKIRTKKFDMFWLAHEKSAEREFDDDFKQLALAMLSPEPEDRPTIEQIKTSQWYSGEVLSRDELSGVFTKKSKPNTLRKIAKKMGLAAEERGLEFDENGLPTESPSVRSVFGKATIIEDDDAFANWSADEERLPPQYTGDVNTYTQFHSNAKASTIINTMVNVLSQARCKYMRNDFGVGFEIMFGDDHQLKVVDVYMNVYQDNDMRLVQFRRRNGDIVLFNEIYDQIVDSLSELVVE